MPDDFKKRLSDIILRIDNIDVHTDPDSSQVKEAFQPLIELAHEDFKSEVVQEILSDPKIISLATTSRTLYQQWRTEREYKIAAGEYDLAQLDGTASFAVLEAQKSNVLPSSNVAFIGSGPLPKSTIAIAKAIGCTVIGIEKEQRAIDLAQPIIDRLSFHNQIHFINALAEEFDYTDFTHIFIANYVYDKADILAQIKKTAAPESVIVCRSADGAAFVCYDQLAANLVKPGAIIRLKDSHLMTSLIFKASDIQL